MALLAPTELFKFLGFKKDEPFVPFQAQAEAMAAVKIPWPGINGRTKKPYPRIFGFCCGRRFSKTTMGEKFLWIGALQPDDDKGPPNVRLTADTEEHAMKIWRPFIHHLHNTDLVGLKKDYSREYQRVELVNGATIQMYSANNPQALSGDGVSLWLIDEAQYLSQEAWDNLFPSISDRHGQIVMLGVAEGEGPFKETCFRGDDPDWPEFCHMTFPTSDNPFIDPHDIEMARRVLHPTKFQQLYLAQWVGELGKIFTNVQGCVREDAITTHNLGYGYVIPPRKGVRYYGGLDLARLQDWTVYTIWDAQGRLVAWDRFNTISWELQINRLAAFSAEYGHPLTVVDSTGIGDPLFDALSRKGMAVQEYKISGNEKKVQLIDELAMRIVHGELIYPRIKTLLRELERMEAKTRPGSSLIRYEAPYGMTDDFVLSCALAMQVVPRRSIQGVKSSLEDLLAEEQMLTQHADYELIK